MRQRALRIMSVSVAALLLGVSFQNCGKAGLDGVNESSLAINTGADDPYPFAFEAGFDQISYNSCFGAGPISSQGYFTIAAGAYQTQGVKVTSDFLQFARTSGELKPLYPATSVSDEQIKVALGSSGNNVEAVPQMAIRTYGNPQQIRTPNSGGAAEGMDYISMLGDLTDDRWMDPLVKTNGKSVMQFFNMAPSGRRTLDARISYNTNESMAQALRDDLRVNGMLALTFKMRSDQADATAARPVSTDDMAKVHGRGYRLQFSNALSPYTDAIIAYKKKRGQSYRTSPHALNPDNILSGIVEVDLKNTSSTTGSWSCPAKWRYLIVDPQDAATHCPKDPYNYMINGVGSMSAENYRREYQIARRHLKSEHWDISVEFRCAVPKDARRSCYVAETDSKGKRVMPEYDQTLGCWQDLGHAYSPPIPTKRCAQFVTICTRK